VGTLAPMRLHSDDAGRDRWQFNRVVHRLGMLLVSGHRAPAMRAGLGLGDDAWLGIRMQGPAPTSTAPTGLAPRPRPWACGEVRLRGMRGRHT
jgi:hypothetical protein